MTVDPKEAAASLSDIANVEQRTRETLVYARSSAILTLWGVLVAGAYVFSYLQPPHATTGWLIATVAGIVGGFVIRIRRGETTRGRTIGQLLAYAQLVLIGYGVLLLLPLWPIISYSQQATFWPTLVMFGHVLAGLWLGRFFIYLGVTVTALILGGYYWAGDWYPLWLAAVVGGGLVAAGLWLRRMG
jgi:hypothetical protein